VRSTVATAWRSLHDLGWTLDRFALTPAGVMGRLRTRDAAPVLCVSIPKAGTHLLERALCLHPSMYRKLMPTISEENLDRWGGLERVASRLRPGQVVASHLPFRDEYPALLRRAGVAVVFALRDPRDIVVSQAHYVVSRADHRAHALFSSLPDERARIRVAIVGAPEYRLSSIGERLEAFSGWLDHALVVRFEDLVGPGGGGDAESQRATLASLYEHIGVPTSSEEIESVRTRLFSDQSPTFRRGEIGGWRDVFDEEEHALFVDVVGDRLHPYARWIDAREF
jgi:sulfotransferase family protein